MVGEVGLRKPWTPIVLLGVQFACDYIPGSRWIGYGIIIATIVALLGWCYLNRHLLGIGIVATGIAMNLLVMVANGGMPYRVPLGQTFETTPKHVPYDVDTWFKPLADVLVLDPGPSISVGDVVIVVGFGQIIVHQSRKKVVRGNV